VRPPTEGVYIERPENLPDVYELPEYPVEVWEEELGDGWSTFRMHDGEAVCMSATIAREWPATVAHTALCRIVANLTQRCQCCGAGVRLTGDGQGVMEHEGPCPLSDDGLADVWGSAKGVGLGGHVPASPRAWVVWVPRLRGIAANA
jgi:hypothetical protein